MKHEEGMESLARTFVALTAPTVRPPQLMESAMQVSQRAAEKLGLNLSITSAVGTYPVGAKLLKGDDKTFVIAPIGNLVEERYSPYIEFTGSRLAS